MAVVRELIWGGGVAVVRAAELASALCTAAETHNVEVVCPLSALLQILNLYHQVGILRSPVEKYYLPFGTLLTLCNSLMCLTREGASSGPAAPPPVYRVIAAVHRVYTKIYLRFGGRWSHYVHLGHEITTFGTGTG